jgi:hypothetical protein
MPVSRQKSPLPNAKRSVVGTRAISRAFASPIAVSIRAITGTSPARPAAVAFDLLTELRFGQHHASHPTRWRSAEHLEIPAPFAGGDVVDPHPHRMAVAQSACRGASCRVLVLIDHPVLKIEDDRVGRARIRRRDVVVAVGWHQ